MGWRMDIYVARRPPGPAILAIGYIPPITPTVLPTRGVKERFAGKEGSEEGRRGIWKMAEMDCD